MCRLRFIHHHRCPSSLVAAAIILVLEHSVLVPVGGGFVPSFPLVKLCISKAVGAYQ